MFEVMPFGEFEYIMNQNDITECDLDKLYQQYLTLVDDEIEHLNKEYEEINNRSIEIILKVLKFRRRVPKEEEADRSSSEPLLSLE